MLPFVSVLHRLQCLKNKWVLSVRFLFFWMETKVLHSPFKFSLKKKEIWRSRSKLKAEKPHRNKWGSVSLQKAKQQRGLSLTHAGFVAIIQMVFLSLYYNRKSWPVGLITRSNCIIGPYDAVSVGDQTSSQARTCGIDAPILCLFDIGLHDIHYSCLTKALNTGRKPESGTVVQRSPLVSRLIKRNSALLSCSRTRVVFQQHVPQAEYRS